MDVIDLTASSSHLNRRSKKISDWVSPSFMDVSPSKMQAPNSKKRKFVRHSSFEVCSKPPTVSSDTWLERYAPTKEEDLAVHKKKIGEVDTWLTSHLTSKKRGAPILLLTGPPGCGKTATLMVIANKHGIHVEEWINPLTTPYAVTRQAGIKFQPQNLVFEDFLFRCGKYPSLLLDSKQPQEACETSSNKLVLIEELPNHIYQEPPLFKDILRKYKLTQRRPLVLIVSDGSSTDAVKRQLIPRDFLQQTGITNISFNGVSATLMSKALSKIAQRERKSLGKEQLSALSSSCGGDIRAAINALQFSSQSDSTIGKKTTASSKSKVSCLGGKDSSLILFRALGKILYCKRNPDPKRDRSDPRHRDPLSYPPEEVIERCCLSGKAFSLFLHHNYLPFYDCNSVEDLSIATEHFSDSDLMNSPLTSSDPSSGAAAALDRYEGIIAARGLVFSNSQRATSDLCAKASGSWRPLHKPSWYLVSKRHQENKVNVSSTFWKLRQPPQELLCTTLPYLLKLRSHYECDAAQRTLLEDVVALPKWKVFRSGQDDRVTEQLAGDDTPEPSSSQNAPCDQIAEGSTPTDQVEEDEPLVIEDFSD